MVIVILVVLQVCFLINALYKSVPYDTTQSLRVKWSDTTSPQFTVMNRVKQGGVLSPILFAIYTDGLLKHLEDTGVGCHMGCRFTGALAYADDITLLATCKSTLSIMIDVCEQYVAEFDILFNGSKINLVLLKVDMLVPLPPIFR